LAFWEHCCERRPVETLAAHGAGSSFYNRVHVTKQFMSNQTLTANGQSDASITQSLWVNRLEGCREWRGISLGTRGRHVLLYSAGCGHLSVGAAQAPHVWRQILAATAGASLRECFCSTGLAATRGARMKPSQKFHLSPRRCLNGCMQVIECMGWARSFSVPYWELLTRSMPSRRRSF